MSKNMKTDMRDFDAICTVMDLLRRGGIDRSTPNSEVYSEFKKRKEVSDD